MVGPPVGPGPEPEVVQIARQFRLDLVSAEQLQMAAMANRWGEVQQILGSYLTDFVEDMIDELEKQNKPQPSPRDIYSFQRYRELMAQTRVELARFTDDMEPELQSWQQSMMDLGLEEAHHLLNASGVRVGFNQLKAGAIENLEALAQQGAPLRELMDAAYGEAAQGIIDEFINGYALGYNGKELARLLADKGLGRARNHLELVGRDQLNRAFREASRQGYLASGVVPAYMRVAGKNERTCPACLALDGEVYPSSQFMPVHPQDRCVMIPLVAGRVPPNYTPAREWFLTLDEETQRRMLGPGRYEGWKEGKFLLKDLATIHDNPVWGPSAQITALKELLAGFHNPVPTPIVTELPASPLDESTLDLIAADQKLDEADLESLAPPPSEPEPETFLAEPVPDVLPSLGRYRAQVEGPYALPDEAALLAASGALVDFHAGKKGINRSGWYEDEQTGESFFWKTVPTLEQGIVEEFTWRLAEEIGMQKEVLVTRLLSVNDYLKNSSGSSFYMENGVTAPLLSKEWQTFLHMPGSEVMAAIDAMEADGRLQRWVLFDYITAQWDRHGDNIMWNAETGEHLLIDNGGSMGVLAGQGTWDAEQFYKIGERPNPPRVLSNYTSDDRMDGILFSREQMEEVASVDLLALRRVLEDDYPAMAANADYLADRVARVNLVLGEIGPGESVTWGEFADLIEGYSEDEVRGWLERIGYWEPTVQEPLRPLDSQTYSPETHSPYSYPNDDDYYRALEQGIVHPLPGEGRSWMVLDEKAWLIRTGLPDDHGLAVESQWGATLLTGMQDLVLRESMVFDPDGDVNTLQPFLGGDWVMASSLEDWELEQNLFLLEQTGDSYQRILMFDWLTGREARGADGLAVNRKTGEVRLVDNAASFGYDPATGSFKEFKRWGGLVEHAPTVISDALGDMAFSVPVRLDTLAAMVQDIDPDVYLRNLRLAGLPDRTAQTASQRLELMRWALEDLREAGEQEVVWGELVERMGSIDYRKRKLKPLFLESMQNVDEFDAGALLSRHPDAQEYKDKYGMFDAADRLWEDFIHERQNSGLMYEPSMATELGYFQTEDQLPLTWKYDNVVKFSPGLEPVQTAEGWFIHEGRAYMVHKEQNPIWARAKQGSGQMAVATGAERLVLPMALRPQTEDAKYKALSLVSSALPPSMKPLPELADDKGEWERMWYSTQDGVGISLHSWLTVSAPVQPYTVWADPSTKRYVYVPSGDGLGADDNAIRPELEAPVVGWRPPGFDEERVVVHLSTLRRATAVDLEEFKSNIPYWVPDKTREEMVVRYDALLRTRKELEASGKKAVKWQELQERVLHAREVRDTNLVTPDLDVVNSPDKIPVEQAAVAKVNPLPGLSPKATVQVDGQTWFLKAHSQGKELAQEGFSQLANLLGASDVAIASATVDRRLPGAHGKYTGTSMTPHLGDNWKALDTLSPRDAQAALGAAATNGQIHKWLILDYLSDTRGRNRGGVMVDLEAGKLLLVDNERSLGKYKTTPYDKPLPINGKDPVQLPDEITRVFDPAVIDGTPIRSSQIREMVGNLSVERYEEFLVSRGVDLADRYALKERLLRLKYVLERMEESGEQQVPIGEFRKRVQEANDAVRREQSRPVGASDMQELVAEAKRTLPSLKSATDEEVLSSASFLVMAEKWLWKRGYMSPLNSLRSSGVDVDAVYEKVFGDLPDVPEQQRMEGRRAHNPEHKEKYTALGIEWEKTMSDDERDAVQSWSGVSYDRIRQEWEDHLRNGAELGDEAYNFWEAVKRAPPVRAVTWRGIRDRDVRNGDEAFKKYNDLVGTTAQWDSPSSCSLEPGVAANFSSGSGGVVFEVLSNRTRYMSPGSSYYKEKQDEYESILPPGSKVRFLSVERVELFDSSTGRYVERLLVRVQDVTGED